MILIICSAFFCGKFMAAPNLEQIERQFFVRKVGANAPLEELKVRYFKQRGAAGNFFSQLETNWLRIEISAVGGVPVGNRKSDLWKQLVAASGFTVTKFLNQNKINYYISAS